jgi:hypothetical protein
LRSAPRALRRCPPGGRVVSVGGIHVFVLGPRDDRGARGVRRQLCVVAGGANDRRRDRPLATGAPLGEHDVVVLGEESWSGAGAALVGEPQQGLPARRVDPKNVLRKRVEQRFAVGVKRPGGDRGSPGAAG